MHLPDYWMEQPKLNLDVSTRTAFDKIIQNFHSGVKTIPSIPYNLPAPIWQFLCYAADTYPLTLHGSEDSEIQLFEPRQSNDLTEFGNQKAVYAAGDGIWAMFFAIVDRSRFAMSVTNACIRVSSPDGSTFGPFYVFSVSRWALIKNPWRTGTVYLLPRATFINQDPIPFGENQVHIPQLASLEPVKPLAKITVRPQDFPFLEHIRDHDDERLAEYARAMESGSPWP
jgi:hypothetical protein